MLQRPSPAFGLSRLRSHPSRLAYRSLSSVLIRSLGSPSLCTPQMLSGCVARFPFVRYTVMSVPHASKMPAPNSTVAIKNSRSLGLQCPVQTDSRLQVNLGVGCQPLRLRPPVTLPAELSLLLTSS